MNHRKIDYKWVIAAICTLTIFTCLGFGNSAKSLFVGPVSEALGVKRAVFALSDTIRYLSSAVWSLFFGRLVLRFGSKRLMLAGCSCVAAASLLFSIAPSIYVYLVGSFLLGTGFAFTTTTMVGLVVSRWFHQGKGKVTGFVLAASGIGGAVSTQVLSPMIFQEGNPLGYQNAYRTTALVVAVTALLVLLLFKDKAENASAQPARRAIGWKGIPYAEAVKKPYFYAAIGLIFLSGLALQGMSGSAATHIKDVGFDAGFTATMLSISMVTLTFSKFITGMIYDRFGLRATVNTCAVAGIGVMFMLAFLTHSPQGSVLAVAYAVINSLALPMETVLIPLYASDLLGERSFHKAIGVFYAANTAGFALGAPIINGSYDLFGSYRNGFLLFGLIMIVVLVGFRFVIAAARRERLRGE